MSSNESSSPSPLMSLEEFQKIYIRVTDQVGVDGRDLRRYKSGTAEVYGEALPILIDDIRKNLKVNENDVFYDIGSGIGNVVIQMSLQTGCRSIGVEIRQDLHEIAVKSLEVIESLVAQQGRRMGNVELYCADVLSMEINFVPESTIVYLNNVCYPEFMQHYLLSNFEETLKDKSRVIAVKDLFPRMREDNIRFAKSTACLFDWPPDVYETPSGVVSWMNRGVSYRVYRVNRSQFNHCRNGINAKSESPSSLKHLPNSIYSSKEKYFKQIKIPIFTNNNKNKNHKTNLDIFNMLYLNYNDDSSDSNLSFSSSSSCDSKYLINSNISLLCKKPNKFWNIKKLKYSNNIYPTDKDYDILKELTNKFKQEFLQRKEKLFSKLNETRGLCIKKELTRRRVRELRNLLKKEQKELQNLQKDTQDILEILEQDVRNESKYAIESWFGADANLIELIQWAKYGMNYSKTDDDFNIDYWSSDHKRLYDKNYDCHESAHISVDD